MTPTNPTAPALDPSATTTPPSNPTVDLLAEPTFEECLEEFIRYHDAWKAGKLSFAGIPEGHYVAYYGGRIVDHDADYMTLQQRTAAALGVHWARLVINYPWMW